MPPTKQPRNLSVHFAGPERERLAELARRDGRSISNMAAKLIRDGLARASRASRAGPRSGASQ